MKKKIRADFKKRFFYFWKTLFISHRKKTPSPSKDVGPVASIPMASSLSVGAHSRLNDGTLHTDPAGPHSFLCSIGATYPKGGDLMATVVCGLCMEPAKLTDKGYVHEEEELDKDHKVRPIRKGDCC